MLALHQNEKTCLEATRTLELAVLEKEKLCLVAERDLQFAFIQKEMICQEAANTLRLAVANSASVDSTMVLGTINALVEGDKFQAMPVNDEPGENSTVMNEKPSNALGEGNKAQAKNKAPAKKAQAKKKRVRWNLTQKKKGRNGTKTPKATTDKTNPNKAHAEKKQVKDQAQTQMDQVLKGLNRSFMKKLA